MSYARKLLEEIAQEMNKPASSVENFIQALESEWYDSKEVIAGLSDSAFEKLKIPAGLVQMIRRKVKEQSAPAPAPVAAPAPAPQATVLPQPVPIQQQQAPPPPVPQIQQSESAPLNASLPGQAEDLKKINQLVETLVQESGSAYEETANILVRLISNILQNPLKEQFRTIKKSNQKLTDTIYKYASAVQILEACGFRDTAEGYYADPATASTILFDYAVSELNNKILQVHNQFDPFAARIWGVATENIAKIPGQEEVESFFTLLEKLKAERKRIMSTPITDRQIRCYVAQVTNQRNVWIEEEVEDVKKKSDSEIKAIETQQLFDAIKRAKASLETETFASKRKQEYQFLIKQPVYDRTLIKIKFKNNIVLECHFSPLETTRDVVQFVQQNLENPDTPFYLYQTPPVQRVTQNNWTQTLVDVQCVPGAVFHFGSDDPQVEKLETVLKSSLLASLNK